MYVKAESDSLSRIKLEGMDEPAEFSENNIAQVKEADGEVLLENDGFSEHTN